MSNDLEQLARRVEEATGPDRELDAEIEAALHGGRASHTFTDDDAASRLRRSYSAGTVFDHADPMTNGGNVLNSMVRRVPDVTGSIDAAMALVPEGLEMELTNLYGVARAVVGLNLNQGPFFGSNECGNIASAVAAAALRAHAARNGQ